MTTPSINEILKYSELQMAAEAFLISDGGPTTDPIDLIRALVNGNDHASRFTEIEAQRFTEYWRVVDQQENTGTGFSGTLFECIQDDPLSGAKMGEQVISFRSTEFIDDAARDNKATNALEIADHGLALGQIMDMEDWYAQLILSGKVTDPTRLSATGYSLGGHLATVFNLLRRESGTTLEQVVTFNGAGVGTWTTESLGEVIQLFRSLQTIGAGESAAAHIGITDASLATLYDRVRATVDSGHNASSSDKAQLKAWSDFAKGEGAGSAQAVAADLAV